MADLELTKDDALRAYARTMNNLDVKYLEPLLGDDFHYASQSVLAEIESKEQYLAYLVPKLAAVSRSGSLVRAEMAELRTYPQGPCVVISQDGQLVATVLVEVENGKIERIDMCQIPSPTLALRRGEYPS